VTDGPGYLPEGIIFLAKLSMQKNRRRKTWQRRRFTKGGEMSTGKRWWSEKEMMQEMIEKWKQAVADWQIQQELAKEQGRK
jgi:hypothetical protein